MPTPWAVDENHKKGRGRSPVREQTGIVQLGWVVMLGEVPCEDVVGPRLPRLSDKGHSWQGGLAPDCLARRSRFGFQKSLSDWVAQNLDRFRRLLEGGRPLLAGGVWLQTVRLGESRLPDSLKAPAGGGDMRRGGGFSSPLSPSVECCRARDPV